jgi:hypothetical protein
VAAGNRTAWTSGNGVGFSWTTAINGSDLASLANGSTVLSSVADITNQTALDLWADISVRMTVASATPPAGSFFAVYLAALLDDGSTYGDGSMTSGATITRAPPYPPVGIIPLESAAAATVLAGFVQAILIPPGSFRLALYNNSGAALSATAGNCIVKYRTYNIFLNQ